MNYISDGYRSQNNIPNRCQSIGDGFAIVDFGKSIVLGSSLLNFVHLSGLNNIELNIKGRDAVLMDRAQKDIPNRYQSVGYGFAIVDLGK